jgi:hypothetical protein
MVRVEVAEPYRARILELFVNCHGHLGRVHEELQKEGATFSYQALTGFCRRHRIGYSPPQPAGRYEFVPGEEMQHDTSPWRTKVGPSTVDVQIVSLVLCFSRRLFFQVYPRFRRFECKVFLRDALTYFGGAAGRCMIDNTHVVVLKGSGRDMVPVPEMVAFGERYGFVFVAHEKGDANRSARVEGPFDMIQDNFFNYREFADFADLNRQAQTWCDAVNAKYSSKLGASRQELFAVEATTLRPLPVWVPEVYQLHDRYVDAEGYVHLDRIRYSVPYQLIARRLEVRELKDRIEIYDGPRMVATHGRVHGPLDTRVTDPSHRPERRQRRSPSAPPEVAEILVREPRMRTYLAAFVSHHGSRTLPLRRLLVMLREFPREPFLAAVARAELYGLYDLHRLERLVLNQIRSDYFVLDEPTPAPENDHDR